MGNWPTKDDRKRSPGKEDVFTEVRKEMNKIQRSRSQSDIIVKQKMQKLSSASASTTQFLADMKEKRSRQKISRQLDEMMQLQQGSPRMKKKKRVRRSQSKQARKERERRRSEEESLAKEHADSNGREAEEVQQSRPQEPDLVVDGSSKEGKEVQRAQAPPPDAEDAPISKEQDTQNIPSSQVEPQPLVTEETPQGGHDHEMQEGPTEILARKVNDDADADDVLPVVPRKTNPYEDTPKKLDQILGPIRSQGPPPPSSEPAAPAAVFYEPGDYSIQGLKADVRLKQAALNGRQLQQRQRAPEAEKGKKRREPAYQVPGQPAKFPKPKQKPKQDQEKPPQQEEDQLLLEQQKLHLQEQQQQEQQQQQQRQAPGQEGELIILDDEGKALASHLKAPVKIEMIPKEEQVEAWLTKTQQAEKPEEVAQGEQAQGGKEQEELLIPLEIAQQSAAPDQSPNSEMAPKQGKKAVASKPALPKALVKPQQEVQQPEESVSPPPPPSPPKPVSAVAPVTITADNTDSSFSFPVSSSSPPRIGINGFERAGRLALLAALEAGLEVAAVNDPFTPANFMAYALKYDLAHSRDRWRRKKESGVRLSPTGQLMLGSKSVEVFDKQDASKIPWEAVGVNYVVETVAPLCEVAEAKRHLREAGSQGKAVQDMLKGNRVKMLTTTRGKNQFNTIETYAETTKLAATT